VRDARSHVSQRLLAPGPVVEPEEAPDRSAGLRRVCRLSWHGCSRERGDSPSAAAFPTGFGARGLTGARFENGVLVERPHESAW